MPLIPHRLVRLQPYYGYRTPRSLHVGARALRSGKSEFASGGRWQAFRTMLAQFASHEVSDLPVRLEIALPDGSHENFETRTDREGYACFDVTLPDEWEMPRHTSWEVVAMHWHNEDGAQCVEGHVLAPGLDARLGVVSDIDDTIIETGITGGWRSAMRNWRRVLQQMPEERIAVPGADVFYSSLGGGRVLAAEEAQPGDTIPATHRPFFYVSSSPWNLYSYLVAFKRDRGLPLGPLFLRDWGLDRGTFGSSSHEAHKTAAIDRILAAYPDMRFALIGDDTQGDFAAFGKVVEHNPGRVAAVFIRKAAGVELATEEIAAKATIEASGVPLWMGDSYTTGRDFLKAAGMAKDGNAARIIETVENDGPSE